MNYRILVGGNEQLNETWIKQRHGKKMQQWTLI